MSVQKAAAGVRKYAARLAQTADWEQKAYHKKYVCRQQKARSRCRLFSYVNFSIGRAGKSIPQLLAIHDNRTAPGGARSLTEYTRSHTLEN